MNVAIDELLHVPDVKEFTRRTKEIEKGEPDAFAWMLGLDAVTAPRLYEPFYIATPCTALAVKATAATACFVPESLRWRLFVRQAWAVAKGRRRVPLTIKPLTPFENGTAEQRFDRFKRAYRDQDFDSAFGVVKGFLSADSEREFFRARSLELALADSSYFGCKALFLHLAWIIAERGEWRWAPDSLLPAFHFLVLGDQQPSEQGQSPIRAGREDKSASAETYREAETALLTGSPEQASRAVEKMAGGGLSTRQVYDGLLLACAQAVINSNGTKWELPVRVFQVISLCRHLDSRTSEPPSHLRTAVVLLNRAARASAETNQRNRTVEDVVARLCPTDPTGVLRSVISHTDPHASATAVLAGLGLPEARRNELLHALWQETIKNDAACACSQDVLYVGQAIEHWRESSWPNRDLLPASAAYLVGRIPKNYQLAAEYGV